MSSRFDELRVFTGNGNPQLANEISRHLNIPMGDVTIKTFPNDNIFVRLNESVREKDVFVIQSLGLPLSNNIMELLIMLDTCRRSSAGRVTAVIPYYAYGRTDKRDQPRVPITARLLADMIQVAGAERVIAIDLHAGQIQGFFSIPVDELSAMPLLARNFSARNWDDAVVVSPDLGFAKRARNFAEQLGTPLAIVEKRRIQQLDKDNSLSRVQALSLIGDVEGRRCILVDDEILTGGSMIEAADLLMAKGAREVYAAVVHAVLAGNAVERLRNSAICELVTTDTLTSSENTSDWEGIRVLSVAQLLAEVIQRIHSGISVGSIFMHRNLAWGKHS